MVSAILAGSSNKRVEKYEQKNGRKRTDRRRSGQTRTTHNITDFPTKSY